MTAQIAHFLYALFLYFFSFSITQDRGSFLFFVLSITQESDFSLFFQFLDHTGVSFFFFIVIDADEQKAPAVMAQAGEVVLLPNLVDCALRAVITLEFDDHSGVIFLKGIENDIRKAFAGSHLSDHGITVERVDVGEINGTLQGVLIVVTAVGGHMDMRQSVPMLPVSSSSFQ